MDKSQDLIFEFKCYEARDQGSHVRHPPAPADDLASIGNSVMNHGGSSIVNRSRSHNSSSIRLGVSQDSGPVSPEQHGRSESHSMTSTSRTLLASFTTAASATAFLKESREVIAHWLQAQVQSSITFQHGRNTVSLKSRDDIDELIARLQPA